MMILCHPKQFRTMLISHDPKARFPMSAIVCLIAPDARETPEYRYIKHVAVLYYIEVRGRKKRGETPAIEGEGTKRNKT